MTQVNPEAESIISDEELELDLTPDGTEDVVTLSEKLANAEKAKKQILARARKAEAEAKALKEAQTPKAEETPAQTIDEEEIDLRLEGYSKDEVRFIKNNGGRKVLEDPNHFVSIALRTRREQAKAEAEASKASDTSGMSEIERKYTPEQLANMSLKELEDLLPKAEPA